MSDPMAFERENLERHFTGSAVVVNRERTSILLTRHAKLGRWLQLGGHCDGIRDPFFVAWKEAYEESGLKFIRPVTDGILDIDIHVIPKHGEVPEHRHYDIRYLFEADPFEPLEISEESTDLRWFSLARVHEFNNEPSMLILADKSAPNTSRRT